MRVRQLRHCRWHEGVDTGTLERIANWSADRFPTVDPCDPGTDPRNGRFWQVSPAAVPFNVVFHGSLVEVVCSIWWCPAVCMTWYVWDWSAFLLYLFGFFPGRVSWQCDQVYRCLFDRDLASD